jgi:hypothetical protein
MALNPEIALGYKPPQVNLDVPSPIHQFGQLMTLRGLMEQGQVRRMQMEQELVKMDAMREAQAGQREFQRRTLAGENLTPGQSLGYLGPKVGGEFLKNQADIEDKQHETAAKRWNRLNVILGSAADTPTYNNAVMQAHSEGYLTPEQAREQITQGFDPKRVEQYRFMAMSGEQQSNAARAQIKAAQEKAAAEAAARLSGLGEAAQTVPPDPESWPAWREWVGQKNPDLLPLIPPQHSPAAYQLVRQFGTKPAAAPQPPAFMPPDILKQQLELRTAGAPRFPSPGMTPAAEAQQIRISQATRPPAAPSSPEERKAYTFYSRAKNAEDVFTQLEDKVKGMGTVGQTWYNYAPNVFQPSTNQVLQQAQRQFTEARLRKESGAAIAATEYEKDAQTYFPQPGDSLEALERKKIARKEILKGLQQESGRAFAEPSGQQNKTSDPMGIR